MHEVVLRNLDVWVKNEGDASALLFNLLVHLVDLVGRKVLRIEFEVGIVALSRVLHRPFNVGPDNIEWESVLSEVFVPLHEHLG